MRVAVSDVVRRKAEDAGVAGWVDELPAIVASLVDDWGLTLERELDGGTEAWVCAVRAPDGEPAVLKVIVPRGGYAEAEIGMLRLIDGDGCVRLLDGDPARSALLLERLGTPMSEAEIPPVERQRILCGLAQRVWRPVTDEVRATGLVIDGRTKALELAAFIVEIWDRTGRPIPRSVVDHALDCARSRERAWNPARAVLAHGDVHRWNALRHGDGWALIDPDGLEIEPEYDLGVLMREDPLELIDDGEQSRAARLAEWTGCDPVAISEWGVVERVSTGLLARSIRLQPIGSQMLAAAIRVAEDAGR